MNLWFASLLVAVASGAALLSATVVGATLDDHVRSATAARSPEAGEFAAAVVRMIGGNRYARAWRSLHPVHRRAAPRALYVGCEELTPIPGTVAKVDVLRASDESVRVPGIDALARGKAVQVRIVIVGDAADKAVVVEDTVHLVRVAGRWAWILPPARFRDYNAGRCPGTGPGPNPYGPPGDG